METVLRSSLVRWWRPLARWLWVLAALGVGASFVAGAAPVTLTVRFPDGSRQASIEALDIDGVAYVPLRSLASQLGGGYSTAPGRVQLDLAGKSAWLEPGNADITSSLGVFVLNYPVRTRDGEALAAADDIPALFDRAFGLAAARELPAPGSETAPGTDSSAVTAEPLEAPLTPLEPQPGAEARSPAPSTEAVEGTAVPAEAVPVAAKPAAPGQVRTVVVDAGHGGEDPGCEGAGGVVEKTLVLALAQRLRDALAQQGFQAVLTREEDRRMSHRDRARLAASKSGDLYVSLHASASLTPGASGPSLYVARDDSPGRGGAYAAPSLALARQTAAALREGTPQTAPGIYRVSCYEFRELAMPAMLVEVGFLTNPEEAALLQTEACQVRLAQALAAAVRQYADQLARKEAAP